MPSTAALRSYWHRRPMPIPTMHIQLFGTTTCTINRTPVTPQLWRSRRAYDLFLYLLSIDRHTCARTTLTALFWPDLDDKAAANNLRVALHRLRHIMAEVTPHDQHLLYADAYTIALCLPPGSIVDATLFADNALLIRRTRDSHYALPLLRQACDLYGGAYLADQPPYEWIYALREHYATTFTDLSLRIGRILLEKHLHPELIERMWRLLAHDPSNETAHQLLMSSYLATGNHDMVRTIYHSCQTSLWHHLGTHPHAQTTDIYHRILSS